MARSFKKAIVRQFQRPTGVLGSLAGLVMASRPSNRSRNTWAVEQLDLQTTDRVLEVGFGPGLALAQIAKCCPSAQVVGIDHSSEMLRQAERRNRKGLSLGRLELVQASLNTLLAGETSIDGPFHKILAVNVAMFWDDLDASIRGLFRLLDNGGTLAIMHQARTKPTTDAASMRAAQEFEHAMEAAGFATIETKIFSQVSPIAVCVLGHRQIVAEQ